MCQSLQYELTLECHSSTHHVYHHIWSTTVLSVACLDQSYCISTVGLQSCLKQMCVNTLMLLRNSSIKSWRPPNPSNRAYEEESTRVGNAKLLIVTVTTCKVTSYQYSNWSGVSGIPPAPYKPRTFFLYNSHPNSWWKGLVSYSHHNNHTMDQHHREDGKRMVIYLLWGRCIVTSF